MRILISAYACEPGKGSEPAVGWNTVFHLAPYHELWVLTRGNNRESIEEACAKHPLPGLHWVYVDLPRWARLLKKLPGGIYWYYYAWQRKAARIADDLHRKHCFDLAHHVTFVTYWMPSFISRLSIPFIWGPVGGGESAPKAMRRGYSLRGHAADWLRDMVRKAAERTRAVRDTARHADIAVATTKETRDCLQRLQATRIEVISQLGLSSSEMALLPQPQPSQSMLVVSAGNLLHWKAYDLALRAIALARGSFPQIRYSIVGDGPERDRLRRLATKLGVTDAVHFRGRLSRQETLQVMSQGAVFLHPSLHDSGGGVCLEAMAAGLPVVCFDLGGPAMQVGPECGIRVPATNAEDSVRRLSDALVLLLANADLRQQMGKRARQRATTDFSWDVKAQVLLALYRRAVGAHGVAA